MKKSKSNWTNERSVKWSNHKEFGGLRGQTSTYFNGKNYEDEKTKGTKMCGIKKT